MVALTLLGCLLALASVQGAYEPDRITSLPGVDQTIPFKQYSGYLNGSDDGNFQLHYWFVESQGNPETDPFVLWLNGGPGCSSLDGFLQEHGPLLVQDDGETLKLNDNAWNKVANMIYLESPVCVGFSYAKDGNCTTDDDLVSLQNYNALLHFYEKFPEYADRDFYITGESYGGIYIPTLSYRIYQSSSKLADNFKGFAIGNGLLSANNNTNSLFLQAYTHGVISQADYDEMVAECTPDFDGQGIPNFVKGTDSSLKCLYKVYATQTKIYTTKALNIYDLEGSCYLGNSATEGDEIKARHGWEHAFSGLKTQQAVVGASVPCINAVAPTKYLSSQKVREALNIVPESAPWVICSNINYHTIYDTMHPQFETLLNGGIRAMLYHGDVDGACNFLGGQLFAQELGIETKDSFHAWYVDQQIAGHWQNYGDILQFTTVKGAGHTVPEYVPHVAFEMFNCFINNQYDL